MFGTNEVGSMPNQGFQNNSARRRFPLSETGREYSVVVLRGMGVSCWRNIPKYALHRPTLTRNEILKSRVKGG